jgi:pimeloyl-ACP methyl ester carboxylesterase
VIARGFAAASLCLGDVAPDAPDGAARGVQALLPDGGRPDRWGTLAAWAFGASRALDALAADPALDPARLALVGHSRGGKAALWCAAQDERVALVVANESGCGGAALARRRFGETVAHVNALFPHWFCPAFHGYAEREDALPVDQHELVALVAPRAAYVASAREDLWADPRGEFLSLVHAAPVYALFGQAGLGASEFPDAEATLHGDGLGYHLRNGGHDLTRADWEHFLDFAEHRLGWS